MPSTPRVSCTVIAVTTDTYDTDLTFDVAGFGYDQEDGSNLTYELLSQPAEGTVTLLEDGTFRFEGNAELSALKRGEIKAVTFEYRVIDGELWSAAETITINVHGTDPGDETIEAFTRSTPSQYDFFPLDGKDGNDTLVFNSVKLTSGSGLEIALGKAIKWTEYHTKPIINIENITIRNVTNDPGSDEARRTLTVTGDEKANVITVENTAYKLFLNGLGGDDTFHFTGSSLGLNSVITGGSGNDTVYASSGVVIDDRGNGGGLSGDDAYHFGAGVQHANFYAGNGQDTAFNFEKGVDKLHFLGGLNAQSVVMTEVGSDTIFTVNGSDTVKVAAVTGLTSGDWLFT